MIFTLNRGIVVQVSVGILVSLAPFLSGLYTGWNSPMITYFSSEDTKLQSGPMTMEEISLMSSLLYIGAILGALISGWLVNKIGRKWSQLIWMLPILVANALIISAESPTLLLVCRAISGTIKGAALVIPPIFTAEIVKSNLKTTVGTFNGVGFTIGIFFSKFLSKLYGIYAVPIASFPIILIYVACLLMCPDTPEYLLFRKKISEAERSLRFYRGIPRVQPLPEAVASEFEEIKAQVRLRSENTSISLKDFGNSTTILAIIVGFILNSSKNFSGLRITISFTESLVKDSGIQMSPSSVDTSISFLQIFGCIAAIYIVRRNPIRLQLLMYFSVSFVALLGTGILYYLHHSWGLDLNLITWLFLIFLAIAIVVPSTMLNNLCVSVPPLIFPVKIRGSTLAVFSIVSMIFGGFMSQYYLYLSGTIGNSTILSAFSVWCLFGAIFTFFFIPEIRNMTYTEIVASLNQRLPQRFRSYP